MTITKAIELLQDLLTESPFFHSDDRNDAVRLGIEALKMVRRGRQAGGVLDGFLLPGETEK